MCVCVCAANPLIDPHRNKAVEGVLSTDIAMTNVCTNTHTHTHTHMSTHRSLSVSLALPLSVSTRPCCDPTFRTSDSKRQSYSTHTKPPTYECHSMMFCVSILSLVCVRFVFQARDRRFPRPRGEAVLPVAAGAVTEQPGGQGGFLRVV